ncbi:MAG: hypothetical protein DHS20C01_13230 [marine bacterium B5-7]|nr:MAG: hypothetical protein DHS20C01_13230 [marine bacterium B5-7]
MLYVQSGYVRQSLHRRRQSYLKNCLDTGQAQLLFIFDRKVGVVRSENGFDIALFGPDRVPRDRREMLQAVFLGELDGTPVFSIACEEHPRNLLGLGCQPPLFVELRQATGMLAAESASLLGYALAMDHWHRSHRFCGACGSLTASGESGHMRICTNPDCERKHFPRTDPAIIVLVANNDACLLGRKREWPDRRYSTIAGFVEPGETPEQAVQREVFEETGIHVANIKYFASQPWPFPGSLMLGYHAGALSETIKLHDDELQDARWYTRDEILDWVPSGRLLLPSQISIAYSLLEEWFNRDDVPPLREIDKQGQHRAPITQL